MILLLLYLVQYTIVPLVEAALDVEGSHPRPWQGTRSGAVLWWQRRHGDRKICSICDIDRDGVTARCGQCDGDTAICPISVHYIHIYISTHSDLSDISVITQPSPPRQLPAIVLIIRILLCVLNF